MMNPFKFVFFLPILLFFWGCSTRIQIAVDADDKTSFHITASVKPDTATLLKSLGSLGQGGLALNVEAVKSSFNKAGFTTVQAVSSDSGSLQIDAGAVSAAKAFSALKKAALYSPGTDKTTGMFQITLSPETMPEILALLPAETVSYLDLLMAPVFTGEKLSEGEYLATIAAVYGKNIVRELSESVLEFAFIAPSTITSTEAPPQTRIEKRGSQEVSFFIPLTALLAEQRHLTYRIQWRR
ncbi:MAG: hypothetical protein LBS97_03855 [Treponema sp.]|jgi:hypothetical protein|nr:hypothetical protein [Treponema sp.]